MNIDEQKIYNILLEVKEEIGETKQGVKDLNEDAKKKNGYITDIYKRIEDIELKKVQAMEDHKRVFKVVSELSGSMNTFLDEQGRIKKQRKDWWGQRRANWLDTSMGIVIGIIFTALEFYFSTHK